MVMTADSTDILIMNLIISLGGVLLAFWVANYRGEMAATKYTLNETRRREHALILVDEPLSSLKGSLFHFDNIMRIWVDTKTGELSIHNIDISDRISPAEELLHEHLKTGYPQLLQSMNRYQDSFNRMANQVLATYQRGMDLLVQKWEAETDLITVRPSPKIYAAKMINIFSQEVFNRLYQKNEPVLSYVCPNPTVFMIGTHPSQTMNSRDAKRIVDDLNSILESPEVFGKLQQLWKETKLLIKEREKIDYGLDKLRTFTRAGIYLQGSCKAGREAHYESLALSL